MFPPESYSFTREEWEAISVRLAAAVGRWGETSDKLKGDAVNETSARVRLSPSHSVCPIDGSRKCDPICSGCKPTEESK